MGSPLFERRHMDELIEILNISAVDIVKWCVIGIFILSAIIGAGIIIGKKLFGAHKELAKRENAIAKSYEKLENHEVAIESIKKDITSIVASVEMINKNMLEMQENVKLMQVADSNRDKKVDALMEAVMEEMGDRIIQKANYYIKLGGIPEDEVDSFTRMFNAYTGIHGNHGAEAKYNYCMDHLPILPVERIIHDHD